MAAVKPKFKVEWTKRDRKTASVPGNTYEDVFKYFQRKNGAGEEWATFHHERPDLSFKPSRGEPITEVTLKVGYVITMPSWSRASSLGNKARAAWDKMMAALEKHENHHRDILAAQSDAFGDKVTAETDLTLRKLGELFRKFPTDVRAAQDRYDSATSHGAKEGVFLPAPDKVKD